MKTARKIGNRIGEILAKPVLGFIIEWILILLLVLMYTMIGFYHYNLHEKFSVAFNTSDAIGVATIVGVILWGILYCIAFTLELTLRIFIASYGDEKDEVKLARLASAQIIYQLVRWPILLGIASSGNSIAITIGYWPEVIIAVIVGLVWIIYRCSKQLKKELHNSA